MHSAALMLLAVVSILITVPVGLFAGLEPFHAALAGVLAFGVLTVAAILTEFGFHG